MEENSKNATPTLLNHALKHGAILGIISIVLTLLLYVIDYTLMVNWKVGLVLSAVLIGYVIYAGIDYRKELGGFMSFGKAFQHGFIMFAVSGLLSTVFSLVLYNVVDTELPAKLTETTIESTTEMMEGFGMPEDKLEEAMEKARKDAEDRFTVAGTFKGYAIGLIIFAVFALITGAIVKRKEPETL